MKVLKNKPRIFKIAPIREKAIDMKLDIFRGEHPDKRSASQWREDLSNRAKLHDAVEDTQAA